jgi:hypothetical protein
VSAKPETDEVERMLGRWACGCVLVWWALWAPSFAFLALAMWWLS